MPEESRTATTLGRLLLTNRLMKMAELGAVFVVAFTVIYIGSQFVGENPLARQTVVWVAYIFMLVLVWLCLRIRGQTWEHFGLSFRFKGWRVALLTTAKSLVVFVAAIAAFMIGSAIVINITGMPESADMSGYNYLRGNLPILILALIAVYIVSSFGEEVIYRAFLINRLAEIGNGGKWSMRGAVVISAVIFGLVHYEWGLMGIVQTFFMGLALGIAYLKVKRNLWVVILAHAYMDTILLMQMYLAPE